ncbi:hypothetical protein NLI96_g5002 [Meripilus lineatus]|uniref:Transmembrane protein n=1 Tax=Meripilus lineatus TaxID=2056292 RepID=A0AAD5YHE2_9APHY|nr:hypothetical protein NLI96_g5002 [Physisporinus lineatus]
MSTTKSAPSDVTPYQGSQPPSTSLGDEAQISTKTIQGIVIGLWVVIVGMCVASGKRLSLLLCGRNRARVEAPTPGDHVELGTMPTALNRAPIPQIDIEEESDNEPLPAYTAPGLPPPAYFA